MITLPRAEYDQMSNTYTGICLACKGASGCCEPDAREYKCDVCGENKVYGLEELVVMEELEIDGGDEYAW